MSGGKVNNWALDQERKKANENKKRKEAELLEMEKLFGKALPAGKKKGGTFGAAFTDPKAKSKKGKCSNFIYYVLVNLQGVTVFLCFS